MMNMKKKLAILAVSAAIIPSAVTAATTSIEATATFLAAITLGNEVDMDFGNVEYSAAPAGGDTASLGTDGNLAFAGNFSGAATGTVGSVDVTGGNDGSTLEVSCDTTATLSDGAGSTINVVSLEVVSETTGAQAFGAGSACAGVGTASTTMVLDIGGGTADQFLFGGQLDGATAAGFAGGAHSTASAGGDSIDIEVVYQ